MKNKINLISISTAAKKLGLIDKNGKPQTHTIRFWEKNFKQIRPTILPGNRRYYNNKDIKLLIHIKELLKRDGFTISGVKNILNKKSFQLDDKIVKSVSSKNIKINLLNKTKNLLKSIKNLKHNG